MGPPGASSAHTPEQAEAAVRDAESVTQYEQAVAHLDALRRGQRITVEPAPSPAPHPPTANGWIVTKTLQRDGRGLIETVTERWAPEEPVSGPP